MSSMRSIILTVIVALSPGLVLAHSIALSFDHGLDPRAQPQAAVWNRAILKALDAGGIKSILGLAGHAVGNHTYSHRDFNSAGTTLGWYIGDAERNERLLSGTPGWTPRFRFPYLKEGDTEPKRDGTRAWLNAHRYESGDPAPYREAYLRHLWDRAAYYDGLSRTLLGRSAKYVILLHTRRINAEFLPDIIAMFHSKGWIIIPPAEAFADPLYAMKPAILPAGESILCL